MWKHILTAALLFAMVAPATAADTHGTAVKKTHAPVIVVYYFYAQPRCQTCRAIEADTGKAVQKHFAKELKSGAIQWHAVDVGKPENKHFIKEFQLYTKSVILVESRNGKTVRHQLLQKVWELIHSPVEFDQYIQKSVEDFIMKGLAK